MRPGGRARALADTRSPSPYSLGSVSTSPTEELHLVLLMKDTRRTLRE
jgi:hypothetical protein